MADQYTSALKQHFYLETRELVMRFELALALAKGT